MARQGKNLSRGGSAEPKPRLRLVGAHPKYAPNQPSLMEHEKCEQRGNTQAPHLVAGNEHTPREVFGLCFSHHRLFRRKVFFMDRFTEGRRALRAELDATPRRLTLLLAAAICFT